MKKGIVRKEIIGATNATYKAKKSDGYSVTVTNVDGCTATSEITTVTINPAPEATVTQSPCSGGSILLTANSGMNLTYQWKQGPNNINGATNQTYAATQSKTYKVVVTNNINGCSKTSAGVAVTITCKTDQELTGSKSLSLYPNPSTDDVSVLFSGSEEGSNIYHQSFSHHRW
jgi:hypothetical protein